MPTRYGHSSTARKQERARVSRLVETDLAGTRHREPGHQPPTFVGDRRGELDAALPQLLDGRLDVVAHEEELVTAGVAWVTRQLARREREDQPAVAASTASRPSASRKNARAASASSA